MTAPGRISASFDASLFASQKGGWVHFTDGDTRNCDVQLVENDRGGTSSHMQLYCRRDGKVIYQANAVSILVKQTDEGFLQVTNYGIDRITLGIKFRNDMDAKHFMRLLQQSATPGPTSMPTGRPTASSHHSEFTTFAGGNYRGSPNGPNSYPQEQFGRRQDQYIPSSIGVRDDLQRDCGPQPVRGVVWRTAPPTIRGGIQEVPRSSVMGLWPKRPLIKSQQELESYGQHLEAALFEGDVDYAKVVVKELVEAKRNQRDFSVVFLPVGGRSFFKLRVAIEREMFPDNGPIPIYLFVTEHDTIKYLQEMVELKYCIDSGQQHWIINHKAVADKKATLKSFGITSNGAEVYVFISKGDVRKDASPGNINMPYQQSVQNQDQRFNQPQQQKYSQNHSSHNPPDYQPYPYQSHTQYRQYEQPDYHHQHFTQPPNQYQRPTTAPIHQQHYGQGNRHQSWHNQQQNWSDQQSQQSYQQHQFRPHYNNTTNPSYPPIHYHNYPPPGTTQQYYHTPHYTGGRPLDYNQPLSYGSQPLSIMPEGMNTQLPEPVRPPTPPPIGWTCPQCTVINVPYRPGCEVCGTDRPVDYKPPPGYKATEEELKWQQDEQKGKRDLEVYEKEQKQLQEKEAKKNYEALLAAANQNLVPNDEEFDCPICFVPIEVGEGVKLRECLHHCCKDCLREHILRCTDADVKCPCNVNDDVTCKGSITELEMKALLTEEEMAKVHNRGLILAEGQSKSYHCKTPDCRGWCIYEDNVNDFDCPVCNKRNCLLCKAIHYPEMNCKEYQEDLRIKAANDVAAQETQRMLENMIKNGEAMYCPNDNCRLIIQKKDGCDWIQCSCGTEICWVTKGPRWGPKGNGDTSGGCKCNFFAGRPCHPNCGCCH